MQQKIFTKTDDLPWYAHLSIWVGYHFFWLYLLAPDWDATNFIAQFCFTFWNAAIVYFNGYFLVPRLLGRGKTGAWFAALLGALFLFAYLLAFSLYFYFEYGCRCGEGGYFLDLFSAGNSILWSHITVLATAMFAWFYLQKRQMQKRQAELEREKITTELKYLKSQLNPHFLFNALNSIYFLIKKDPDKAAEALAGFSDLLRYQLYQTEGEKIDLGKELESLHKYIGLAALRKAKDLELKIDLPTDTQGAQITPLLLSPLVENVFKHAAGSPPKIEIKGELSGDIFTFTTVNNFKNYTPEPTQVPEAGGIGLVNIRRRLDLIYPQKYELTTDTDNDIFTVRLKLELL